MPSVSVTFAAAVMCACVMAADAQTSATDEFGRLQGTWTVTAAEQNGKPFDVIKGGVLTITDSTFALRTAAGNEFKGELRINPATTPRQLDFVHANGMVWEAI